MTPVVRTPIHSITFPRSRCVQSIPSLLIKGSLTPGVAHRQLNGHVVISV
jgi:hypothetical protein